MRKFDNSIFKDGDDSEDYDCVDVAEGMDVALLENEDKDEDERGLSLESDGASSRSPSPSPRPVCQRDPDRCGAEAPSPRQVCSCADRVRLSTNVPD